jgi:hypothetical protein
MEFADQFEQDFMRRTLSLLQNYHGPYDATLLLNCLVGLLIVPRAIAFRRIPDGPISNLRHWGLSPKSIASYGRRRPSDGHDPDTVRGVVQSLRNSIAHFRINPEHESGRVTAFRFRDDNGFDATIPIEEIREFVEMLATFLQKA